MTTNSAEYMRAYRARRKAQHAAYDEAKPLIGALKTDLGTALRRITELEEEVRHLKAELAKRPLGTTITPAEAAHLGRKAQQAERDRILRAMNKGV